MPKKLGITEATLLVVLNGPSDYAAIVGELPAGVRVNAKLGAGTNLVHLFVTEREVLASELARLRKALHPDAVVWVSWPKKSAKVPTTVTEDTIRELALPLGWVDVKVCAVTEVWSGLKLVVRKELRSKGPA
ncbi:DUF3052 family protein [Hylemonella gracilis]|uniref:DUF3052 family protein n=1 Tax=Hylemonella gracilis TaxID=80880 RepID=A0A4P6UKB6_9BURK|nr:DUF3052 family protein [Hylemonella gracilis]QBK05808.1 DUF3052 family protein [Hylemonella gracilis]